ncbi:interferon gamma receptor 1 [Siniperca chuatsi]|uniref:interferon gamma receptor 1 n=1 Tax=Siniperca chuatsi TaxID=119488 RepID=UPI001CE035CD|nr:interferon gamma receptor 1 [Siniperca chuatsi]
MLDRWFTGLLLLISGVSAVIVLPPTNVTVSCQNPKVTVSWEYSTQQPQTSFRVHIQGSEGNNVIETTDHQCDLSHFIWESEKRYLSYHYVNVTALRGGRQSAAALSKSFSFNDLKTADIKCKLNFPPVNLNVEDSGATVSFRNPFHHYSELKQATKPDDATFKFTVTSGGKDYGGEDCTVNQLNCKYDVPFPEGVAECVTLTGSVLAGNEVGEVLFNKTDSICPSNAMGAHMITLIILLSAIVFVIIVVTIIIYNTRAWTWTKNTPSLPKTLDPLLPNPSERDMKYCPVSTTDISPVTVIVSLEEGDLEDSSAGSDYQSSAASYMQCRPPERQRIDDDSSDGSVKTECFSIDLEEEEEVVVKEGGEKSPYDCPHILQVDMGEGDMATGYRG